MKRNGNRILNGLLVLSVAFCLSAYVKTNFDFPIGDVAHAAANDSGMEIVEITSYSDDQIVVIGGMRYFLEGAGETIENIQGDNVVYKAIIINGKCTSILTDVRN